MPEDIQALTRQAYRQWLQDPYLNSLRFKQVHPSRPYYSLRIGAHWRVVGEKDGNDIVWFWIGPHSQYDKLLDQLR